MVAERHQIRQRRRSRGLGSGICYGLCAAVVYSLGVAAAFTASLYAQGDGDQLVSHLPDLLRFVLVVSVYALIPASTVAVVAGGLLGMVNARIAEARSGRRRDVAWIVGGLVGVLAGGVLAGFSGAITEEEGQIVAALSLGLVACAGGSCGYQLRQCQRWAAREE